MYVHAITKMVTKPSEQILSMQLFCCFCTKFVFLSFGRAVVAAMSFAL